MYLEAKKEITNKRFKETQEVIVRKNIGTGIFEFAVPTHGTMNYGSEQEVIAFMQRHGYKYKVVNYGRRFAEFL